jgi:hypothetical protein
MALLPFPHAAPARSVAVASTCLGGALIALAAFTGEAPQLAAATNQSRVDLDGDGLCDLQELVIGTSPTSYDTDADTYSDLEERARGSDPLDILSLPQPSEYGVGMCASLDEGMVTLVSAVYLDQASMDSVQIEVGIVYRRFVIYLPPSSYTYSRGYIYPGHDASDTLAVIEIALSNSLVRRLGQVNMFSVVRSTSPTGPDPVVSILPLVDFGGTTVAIEQLDLHLGQVGGGQPTGVVYRPLAGDDQIPSTWSGGEICWQRTAAIGMSGVSIEHEVDAADCIPMDTYCSPSACQSGVGTTLLLPDPAALAGG